VIESIALYEWRRSMKALRARPRIVTRSGKYTYINSPVIKQAGATSDGIPWKDIVNGILEAEGWDCKAMDRELSFGYGATSRYVRGLQRPVKKENRQKLLDKAREHGIEWEGTG